MHAEIPGDGSTTQEVAIGGHLYEGVIKQGANDDNSGCALTLEIGRTYLKLINEGKLPRPKRTSTSIGCPRSAARDALLDAHTRRRRRRIIGDLNFDMEAHAAHHQPELLDHAAHAGHLPVVHQRHRARA